METISISARIAAKRFPIARVRLVEEILQKKRFKLARVFLVFFILLNGHAHFFYLFAISVRNFNPYISRVFITRAIQRTQEDALLKTYKNFLADLPITSHSVVWVSQSLHRSMRNWNFPIRKVGSVRINRKFNRIQKNGLEEFLIQNPNLEDLGAWRANLFLPAQGRLLSTKSLLRHQIGSEGMRRPGTRDLSHYIDFLASTTESFDLRILVEEICSNPNISLADLGTVVDFTLISRFRESPIRILEIGGGYGRLAEGFLSNMDSLAFQKFEKYVLVDAIPESISSAKAYLHALARQEKLQITPAWDNSWLESKYDLIINVESFQEMTDSWIEFYSDRIDRVSELGTILYLSNSTSHFNSRGFIPTSVWQQVGNFQSPRHWTSSHSTLVYKKNV